MSLPENYHNVEMSWVGDWIGRRAELTPTREAVFEPEHGRWTYGQLNDRAQKTGRYLLQVLGLKKGDVVALLSRNRIEALDLYFAAGKTGSILAPLSYRLASLELLQILGIIRPQVLIYEEHFESLARAAQSLLPPERRIPMDEAGQRYAQRVLSGPAEKINHPLAMNDPFLYIHTGGSTGIPKVCVVSHRQMIWNSFNLLATDSGALGAGSHELVTFPLYHIGGWNTVTPIVHIGGRMTMPRHFEAKRVLELVAGEGITHFGAVEAMLRLLIESPLFAGTDFKSLQSINSAGAPCAEAVMQAFANKGVAVTQSYGLTEAGPSNCILSPEGRGPEELARLSRSIGNPMFHCDARLLSSEGDPVSRAGEIGELCFRSPHSFDGYLQEDGRVFPNVDADGWIHSGDLAQLDEEGLLYLVGRRDNVFISGGENVAPEEVEAVLLTHPSISRTCLIDVPDARWGRVGAAAVVPSAGTTIEEEEVQSFCRRFLAAYKVPRFVIAVESLPLTGSGKVDRAAVRELIEVQLGGEG